MQQTISFALDDMNDKHLHNYMSKCKGSNIYQWQFIFMLITIITNHHFPHSRIIQSGQRERESDIKWSEHIRGSKHINTLFTQAATATSASAWVQFPGPGTDCSSAVVLSSHIGTQATTEDMESAHWVNKCLYKVLHIYATCQHSNTNMSTRQYILSVHIHDMSSCVAAKSYQTVV